LPAAQFAQALAAGIAIVSTSTPTLNGAYAIDTAAVSVIDGIYAGIRGGDDLPGGGATFSYRDIAGAPHDFSEATFAAFAKAVRDYRYALSEGQAPAQPVTIA
jgi:hypothetical protein